MYKYGLFIVFCLNLISKAAFCGGSISTTGGGSGVGCFKSAEIALKHENKIVSGNLSDSFYEDLDIILSLEHAEQYNIEAKINELAPEERWKNFSYKHPESNSKPISFSEGLNLITKKINYLSPFLAHRLDQLKYITNISKWKSIQRLPLLQDAIPLGGLPPQCRRIQIILRKSSGNNPIGDGPVKRLPQISFSYNQRLFSLLSPLDQNTLILHEQFYCHQ